MRFHFRPVLTVAALFGLGVLIGLGTWQLHRLEWKRALIAQVEARIGADPISFDDAKTRALAGENMEYTPVFLEGVFDHGAEEPVFGSLDGRAGAYIFTPLRRATSTDENDPGAAVVYINRGFATEAALTPQQRPQSAVAGPVRVVGLFREHRPPSGFAALLQPARGTGDPYRYRRDPVAFAEARGLLSIPFYVDSAGEENPAPWPKGGTTRVEFSNRHFEYALTWFGLAAALLGVYLAYSLRRS